MLLGVWLHASGSIILGLWVLQLSGFWTSLTWNMVLSLVRSTLAVVPACVGSSDGTHARWQVFQPGEVSQHSYR
jgi:hypothetical protein